MMNQDVPTAIADSNDEESHNSIANKMLSLDGYTKESISNILKSKGDRNEDISLSYLRLVDFKNIDLLEAYRKLALHIFITGDSQNVNIIHERFCKIFSEQNPNSYAEDPCHTLVTAFAILNADLHNKHIINKMTSNQFASNIIKEYPQFSFDSDALKAIHKSIKREPIKQNAVMIQQRKRSIGNDTDKNTKVKKPKRDANRLITNETSRNNNVPQIENIRNFGFQILKMKPSYTSAFQIFENKTWKPYFSAINNLKLILYNYDEFRSFYENKIKETPSKMDVNEVGWIFIQSYDPVHELPLHHALSIPDVGDRRKCEITLSDNSRYILKLPEGTCAEKWSHCLNHASSLQSMLPGWTVEGPYNGPRAIIRHKWSSEISNLSPEDQREKTRHFIIKYEDDMKYLMENSKKYSDYKSCLKYVTSVLNRFKIYYRTLDMFNEATNRANQSSANEITGSSWIIQNSLEASTSSVLINSSSRMPMTSISEITQVTEGETET